MNRNDGTHDSDPIKSTSSKGPDKKNTPEKDGPKKHPGQILVMKIYVENGH